MTQNHPEDTQAVYIDDVRGADWSRLDDALSASDRGLDVEVLRSDEHSGAVLVAPELALGYLYVALDQHADQWADEREASEAEAIERLRDGLYEGLQNARAVVGLARIQFGRECAGDREAVEETYDSARPVSQ